MLLLFDFTENVAEENLFYIVSPKDLVLAKVRYSLIELTSYRCELFHESGVTIKRKAALLVLYCCTNI